MDEGPGAPLGSDLEESIGRRPGESMSGGKVGVGECVSRGASASYKAKVLKNVSDSDVGEHAAAKAYESPCRYITFTTLHHLCAGVDSIKLLRQSDIVPSFVEMKLFSFCELSFPELPETVVSTRV